MIAFAFALLLAPGPQSADAEGLRSQISRLESETARLKAALGERDSLLAEVKETLVAARREIRDLKESPQPVAAPFLASPPPASDRLGVARGAAFAPRLEVDSSRRHDTILVRLRRVEPSSIRLVAELEMTSDLAGLDLPLDQNGALYIVEWSTSEGHVFDLLLRDGASGQLISSVPVKERQSDGRFVLVGYRLD